MPRYDRVADKWMERASQAAREWLENTLGTDQDPIRNALSRKEKWAARIQEAIANGTWEQRLSRVDRAYWQRSVEAAGTGAYTQGLAKGKHKMQRFVQAFTPVWEQARQMARQMPAETYEQRKQIALAVMDLFHSKKGQW